jgi:hypothetical protein
MRSLRRSIAVIALLALSVPATGCYGTFTLTKSLHSWNGKLGDKFVNALVFFAFVIIPVYEVVVLADMIVLNTIEFWSGKNPTTAMKDGEVHEKVAVIDGKHVKMTIAERGARLRLEVDGKAFEVRAGDRQTQVLDGAGAPIAIVEPSENGAIIRGSDGQVREVGAMQLLELAGSLRQGSAQFLATLKAQPGQNLAMAPQAH